MLNKITITLCQLRTVMLFNVNEKGADAWQTLRYKNVDYKPSFYNWRDNVQISESTFYEDLKHATLTMPYWNI